MVLPGIVKCPACMTTWGTYEATSFKSLSQKQQAAVEMTPRFPFIVWFHSKEEQR